MSSFPWINAEILKGLETEGLITRTFSRLDEGRRDEVLSAIFEEATKSGPDRIAIKDVAVRAAVPVGSLYQYFGNREKLARCATLLVARRLVAELEKWTPYLAQMPLREALSAYLKTGLAWSREEAAVFRSFVATAYGSAQRGSVFAFEESQAKDEGEWTMRELVEPVAAAIQGMVRAIIGGAAARGELAPGVAPEEAARLAGALLIAVGDASLMPGLAAYYRLFDEAHGPEPMIDAAVDFICRSVMAR
jgi:AcrR family transcriptional regulator